MDFNLTQKQEETRKLAKEFAENVVEPIAAEIDAEVRFPIETIEKAAELGFMGYPFPEKYGGHGADYVSYVMMIEEISKVCASTGVIIQTHCALCSWPILTYGTEEQKTKYLPQMYSGKKIGAFGLTERGAGSDAASIKTIAEDKGDHWLLNGSKIFISNSGIAEIYVVFAMTDISKGTRGISAFIVEKGTEGFKISEKQDKMGIRGSLTAELFFEDCKIPKENLLGEINRGFKIALTALDVGRLGISAQAIGIAQGAFRATVEYMKTREQFGRTLDKFQALTFEMAEMETQIDAARFMLYNAAFRREKGLPSTVEAAKAKLICSETAMRVATRAVQFHGGYGYLKANPVERMMRDAKITEIYEGTSEVMKMIISGNTFK